MNLREASKMVNEAISSEPGFIAARDAAQNAASDLAAGDNDAYIRSERGGGGLVIDKHGNVSKYYR